MTNRPALFLALCPILLCVFGVTGISRQGGQVTTRPGQVTTRPGQVTTRPGQVTTRPGQLTTRPGVRIADTFLRVNRMVGGGDEFQDWGTSHLINGPAVLPFRWSTKTTGASAARWVVTDLPIGKAGAKTVKWGALLSVPGPGQVGYFWVDFTSFIPATPPKKPYVLSYYVYVILSDSAKNDLAPSSAVSVSYGEPGAQPQIDEDMGVPSNQSSAQSSSRILALAREALKVRFGLYNAVGDVQTTVPGIGAFQRFKNAFGEADASIEVSGPEVNPTIYVGVPVKSPFGGGKFAYQWYRYTVDRYNRVIANSDPGSEVPGPPAPVLPNPGAWSRYSTYYGIPGADPPHWSPVLVKTDSLKITKLHHDFQFPAGYEKTKAWIEGFGVNMANVNLTQRAMEEWQPVKLVGFIEDAWYTGGDYGADHTEDYNDGADAPRGGVSEETDPAWPGLDWDMTIIPDPPYNYLASSVRPTVRVEMEHFALGIESYWPKTDDWLQAVGRWVVDCGHTSYTEIHPPELLVASTQNLYNTTSTRARVTVTGAYLGDTLEFVVNPPPRPSATSKMYYKILKTDGSGGYDRKDNVNLEVMERGTPGNPNHLFVRVVPAGPGPVVRYDTGTVGYARGRGLQCIIECGWGGGGTGTIRVSAAASKAVGYQHSEAVTGAYLFYRSAETPKLPWQAVRLNDHTESIALQLPIGRSFWFRPAGSGWNFVQPELGDPAVPAKVVLKQDQVQSLDFGALADKQDVQLQDLRTFVRYGRSPSSSSDIRRIAVRTKGSDPVEAANQALRSALIALEESGGTLGVKGNNLGYKETTNVFFRLKSLNGEDGQPIKDQASAVLVDSSANPPSIALRGVPGGGVSGAKVRAKLLLGNELVGFRLAGQADVVTGHQGLAQFRVEAGSHVEDAVLSIEVLENPANPWFLPKILSSSRLFYPGDNAANAMDSAPGRVPYGLRGIFLDAAAVNALLAATGSGSEGKHFLEEVQEQVVFEQNIRKKLGRGDAAALRASFAKLIHKKK